ncbi:MAG: hypothetical protein LUG16_06665, partial [Candidatus Gastranaerophilales bacterium]|nr:hypothetical protein [Candidatus Gastranaerophilales bacterium]
PNKVNFEGVINNYLKSPEGQIGITGNIQSESLGKIVDKLVKLPYKASGAIHTAGKLKFGKSGNNIKLQLKSNENNYLSYLVVKELLKKPVIHNFDIDLEKDSVKINNISIYEDSAPSVSVYLSNLEKYKKIISLNGNIINLKSPEFQNFHINIPEKISFASNFFGGEEAEIRADIKLNGNINNPELRGSAKIDKYNLKRYLTSINNADISFADNNIRLIAPDVRVNNSKFNLTADIEPSLKPEKTIISSLHINSLNLDLNTLFELIMKERNFLVPEFFVIKKGTATINNFKILDLKAHDISSDLAFDNNTLKLTNISASAYNGHIQGSSSYNVSTGALSVKMEGNGLDIKSSVYDLCKLEDNISGTTDLKANISMMTGPYNEVIKSLSGKASFKAKNGRMGTLGKFEYYLHAQNILYHGFLNTTLNRIADAIIPDNTAQYREASGEILFQNGFIISDNIKTSGDKMSLYLKGRHNLLTNHANIEIYGRISDEISHKLGTFGEVSLSEIINGQSADKNVMVYKIPYETINKIPDLYNNNTAGTNTFKVNIYGNLDSLGAINSFIWIKADKENITPKEDKLPDFSDISPL